MAVTCVNHGVGVVLFGTLIALPQWLILRRHLRRAHWWVPLTAAGILIGLGTAIGVAWVSLLLSVVVASVLAPDEAPRWLVPTLLAIAGRVLPGAAAGYVVGVVQAAVFARHAPGQGKDWWVRASVVGGIMMAPAGATLVFGCASGSIAHLLDRGPLAGAVGGVGYGIATGMALVRLLEDRSNVPSA